MVGVGHTPKDCATLTLDIVKELAMVSPAKRVIGPANFSSRAKATQSVGRQKIPRLASTQPSRNCVRLKQGGSSSN
jgi:hypothetical protein